MKTIYLDHNIVHYYVLGFPPNIDEQLEKDALQEAKDLYPDIRFVVSLYNIVEASRERPREKVREYGEFLNDLNPLFFLEHLNIQKMEMEKVVFSRYFDQEKDDTSPFVQHLSQVWDSLNRGVPRRYERTPEIRESITDYALELFDNPASQETLLQTEAQTPGSLIILQKKGGTGTSNPANQSEMNRGWFRQLMPDRGPDRKPIELKRKEQILEELVSNTDTILEDCPAINAENHLTDFRTSNPNRNPTRQDAIDLMHAVVALAYCDAFITNDGYVLDGAQYVSRRSEKGTIHSHSLAGSLEALKAH